MFPDRPISRREQFRQEKQAREKEARRQDGSAYVNQTPFRYEERYYKSRQPAPDFSMAIDPHQQPCPNQLTPVQLSHDLRQLCPWFGSAVDPHRSDTPGQAFVLNTFPGLVIIPNPFSPSAQRHLIQQCLSEYPKSPNVSNLHTHYRVPDTGLWPLFQQEAQGLRSMDDPSGFVPKKSLVTTADDTQTVPVPAQNSRTLAIPLKACDDKFDPRMKVAKPEPLPSKTVETMPTTQLIRHLRWITLGYHYHWPTRTYHLDRQFPMPEVVARLSHAVVQSIEGVGGQGWTNTYRSKDYRAEAGVINYYQYRDALMGHVDRSELNMDAPLVSVSLGNACIFLIGGPDRDAKPSALYLRSGDIVVMTQPCRRSFHSVPRIIENTLPEYLQPDGNEDDVSEWNLFGKFMETTRLNINVRQVNPIVTQPS